jgi:hypothetical protein
MAEYNLSGTTRSTTARQSSLPARAGAGPDAAEEDWLRPAPVITSSYRCHGERDATTHLYAHPPANGEACMFDNNRS